MLKTRSCTSSALHMLGLFKKRRHTVPMRRCCDDLLPVSTRSLNHLLTTAEIRLHVRLKCQVGSEVGALASRSFSLH